MMICVYCGEIAPENPIQSCCGEIHFIEAEECPECNSIAVIEHHHQGDIRAPECTYKECEDCHHQWDHN